VYKSTGSLIYDPHARIKAAPYWCILRCDEGIIDYYKYWIRRHFDVKFEKTVWGSHISVNRGVQPPNKKLWGKHKGEVVSFTYTNRIYRVNNWFYCVDAYSQRLEEIRTELGLAKTPPYGFHLTIARINKEYILKQQGITQ
jgi:hypothetical protein